MLEKIPSYQVEYIPAERRLGDRRVNPSGSLPPGVSHDRRKEPRRDFRIDES
jgi:hypothetical protein